MIIKNVQIEKFRGFKQAEFALGTNITVIAGQNGTQKTTLLGMISQPFSISGKTNPLSGEKPLCGGSYRSGFSEKFKLSASFDKPKSHEWTLNLVNGDPDFTVESMPRSASNPDVIRFWRKGDRTKGSGYIPLPVIYLSLSRLFPIGEDQDLDLSDEVVLTQEEIELYSELHNRILIIPDAPLISIDFLSSTQKKTLGASTDYYDWRMNSAGQDNIGKILLAILSFKRLKKQYPTSYKGGLLVIDELDATLYPASQIKLLDVLRKYSSQLDVQVVFTTHSLNILERSCELQNDPKLRDQVKVVFLRKNNHHIKIVQEPDYDYIKSMLNNVLLNVIKPRKIRIFTEDQECIVFCRSLLGRKISSVEYIDCTFGCDSLVELVSKGVPGFRQSESIIVLDGDVSKTPATFKKARRYPHIMVLPGDRSPERVLAEYLYALSDDAPEWEQICEGYRKQIAFGEESIAEIRRDRVKAKQWFQGQQRNWGRNSSRMINLWRSKNQKICNDFVSKFLEVFRLAS